MVEPDLPGDGRDWVT